MLSVKDAQEKILAVISPTDLIEESLESTSGKYLGKDIIASMNLPPFDNSSMDGFAVQSKDTISSGRDHPITLRVIDDIPAGKNPNIPITPGSCARIMTGAPIPQGADAVIKYEDTDFNFRDPDSSAPLNVNLYHEVQPGDNIRTSGEDICIGDLVLERKTKLRPQGLGFLASLGYEKVTVHRSPVAAIVSSGDELIPASIPLTPGKTRDSNSYTLRALTEETGTRSLNLGIVPDEKTLIKEALDEAVDAKVDLIISSAGVSVGAFDYVRHVVIENGSLDFWKVNVRPGKPLAFGSYRGIPFFGLPGNPVSAFVSFELFVRPVLLKLIGAASLFRPVQSIILEDEIQSDGRESYLRGIAVLENGIWKAKLTGHQGSGNLHSLIKANTLLILPSGVKSLPAGSQVSCWFI
ncbi:MAG TPA: gephyrin-like molybdotransferase Glp [Anaerolineales bacterium]|nr:gephyrin-like molybdotransferase Glp [Anaerolineales bacterium]